MITAGTTLFLGNDQKAVQHPEVRYRTGTGEDENGLVRIGDDDLLVFAAGCGGCARKRTLALYDLFDHPTTRRKRRYQHMVS